MKLHFLQRCAYLGWLLLALTASVNVQAMQQHYQSSVQPQDNAPEELEHKDDTPPLSSDDHHSQSQLHCEQFFQIKMFQKPVLGVQSSRIEMLKKKAATCESEADLTIDPKIINDLLTIITVPNQQLLVQPHEQLSSTGLVDNQHGSPANENAQKTKEQLIFELLYDRDNDNGNSSQVVNHHKELSDDLAKAYAQTIFNIGAYYINKDPEAHKQKLLYYFFRPYEMTSINQEIDVLATQYQADLLQIARRIHHKQIRKAFVEALAAQHSLFMHGFTTPWLWENDPIRHYFPSVWYFYSMLSAKLCQLSPWADNYQGLHVLLGIKPNLYTQVIEAQSTVVNDILYPTKYNIYHLLHYLLMYSTVLCIISAFTRLKKQRDKFTLLPGIDRKKIHSRVRGDFRSVFIDLLREVPWLHDYALADHTGTINDIGKLFVLLLFFSSFDCLIPKSEVKANELFW